MSKRSERRAAERASHKANRPLAAAAVAAAPSQPLIAPELQATAAPSSPISFTEVKQPQPLTIADIEAAGERTRRFLLDHPVEPKPSTTSDAQTQANRENAQKSTGPTSAAGKQTVSQNRRCHGLIGAFQLHPDESPADYMDLVEEVHQEYTPQTDTEARLACSLIQHYWLMQRAIRLQGEVIGDDDKKLALYLRYQTTHERSYYKAQKELKATIKERAKTENGFEQQTRKDDLTEARTRLTHAKAHHLEIDTACRQVMDSPIPGHGRIGFEQLTKACSEAIAVVLYQNQQKAAA